MNATGIKAIRDALQKCQDELAFYKTSYFLTPNQLKNSEIVKQLERQEYELKEALKELGIK